MGSALCCGKCSVYTVRSVTMTLWTWHVDSNLTPWSVALGCQQPPLHLQAIVVISWKRIIQVKQCSRNKHNEGLSGLEVSKCNLILVIPILISFLAKRNAHTLCEAFTVSCYLQAKRDQLNLHVLDAIQHKTSQKTRQCALNVNSSDSIPTANSKTTTK